MAERIRWWLITQLDRLPGQCWSDLVSWSIGWSYRRRGLPWSPVDESCRDGFRRTGTCYCGKLRRDGPGPPRRHRARRTAAEGVSHD